MYYESVTFILKKPSRSLCVELSKAPFVSTGTDQD
jgi:hypothetical protein